MYFNNFLIILCSVLIIIFHIKSYSFYYCNNNLTLELFSENGKDYDTDYVKIYNKVFNDDSYIKYNIEQIYDIVKSGNTTNIKILEAGCGVGADTPLIKKLISKNLISVDKSTSLIDMFKYNNPRCDSKLGNLINVDLFKNKQFDIILALHNTLYHNTKGEIKQMFQNFSKWIKSGGLFIFHIYDINKLDPAPREFSQYYTNKKHKNKHSLTQFEPFVHDAYWNDDFSIYNEKIVFRKTGNIKTQKHKFYWPSKEFIIAQLKDNGFKFMKEIDLKNIQVEDAVLTVFKKM